MNGARRTGGRRRITTMLTFGNSIKKILSRKECETSGTVRRILSVFEPKIESTNRLKKLMKNSWQGDVRIIVNIADFIQNRMHRISIIVVLVYYKPMGHSLRENGRSSVNTTITPVFVAGNVNRR